MILILIKLVSNWTHDYTPKSHTLSRHSFNRSSYTHCAFPYVVKSLLNEVQMHCTTFSSYSEWTVLFLFILSSTVSDLLLFIPFILFFSSFQKPLPWPLKENLAVHPQNPVKGESSKSLMIESTTPFIPSPLTSLDVPKTWFKNHTAFGRWIDTFKYRSLSYVDILDYNFFLFGDFEIIS